MNTFQTLTSLVLLIFVLSVIVQALQELVKATLGTKADVMEKTIVKFMGAHLPLPQVQAALSVRGLDITALEHLSKEDFRHLLDAIPFEAAHLQGIVASAQASVEQIKDNMAASYEAARATFQGAYARKNKLFVVGLSLVVVILLNANLVVLYEQISADQGAQQAIVGRAAVALADQTGQGGTPSLPGSDLGSVYSQSREQIGKALENYPILVRTARYPKDFREHPYDEVLGLLFMGILVSLGAPFWNDVLKGMMGVNNALNTNARKTS